MPSAIDISDLEFEYSDGFSLRVDRLKLDPGEQALLCGPSGCGKSTLMNLVSGLLDASGGSILISGESITDSSGSQRDAIRGRLIGMVFQTHHLLVGFTARENLEVAMLFSDVPRSEHRSRAEKLLARLQLDRINAPVERLSVGQQQRVAIARALASRPKVVLADEPTASLDPSRAEEAMKLLRNAAQEEGAALLVSSHDPDMPKQFDRVIEWDSLSTFEGAQ